MLGVSTLLQSRYPRGSGVRRTASFLGKYCTTNKHKYVSLKGTTGRPLAKGAIRRKSDATQ